MTAKEALEKSIEMWQYIKEHNCKFKEDYFENNNIELNVDCGCYLCEYSNGDCKRCPVKNWSLTAYYAGHCCDIDSVYYTYNCYNMPAYSIAVNMLIVLNRALAELNNSNYKEC